MKAALSVWSTAVSKPSAAAQASAKTTFGFLPPDSSAIFLAPATAAAPTFGPETRPPVDENRVDRRMLTEPGARRVARAGHDVRDASLDLEPGQVDGGQRCDLAGLDHERVPRGLAGDQVREVAEGVRDVVDLHPTLGGLLPVPRFGQRDLLAVPLEEASGPAEHRGALGDRGARRRPGGRT